MKPESWLLAFVLTGAAYDASATLGQDPASVSADRRTLAATQRTTASTNYTMHELQLPTGTAVREFVASNGMVFAVAWQGPSLPDLRQLLGAYFQPYLEASTAQGVGIGTRTMQLPGLVVNVTGHMRAFASSAYLPKLLPLGVSAEEIQ